MTKNELIKYIEENIEDLMDQSNKMVEDIIAENCTDKEAILRNAYVVTGKGLAYADILKKVKNLKFKNGDKHEKNTDIKSGS